MDPTATLEFMYIAMGAFEYEDALELAEALTSWLDRGGFPPEGHTEASARAEIDTVLRQIDELAGINLIKSGHYS